MSHTADFDEEAVAFGHRMIPSSDELITGGGYGVKRADRSEEVGSNSYQWNSTATEVWLQMLRFVVRLL
jgi:hypothetical protein